MSTAVNTGNAAMERINADARRLRLEREAAERLSELRTRLTFSMDAEAPLYFPLAITSEHKVDWDIPTACTNGAEIRVNPEFWMSLSLDEADTVYMHELTHDALEHPRRFMHLRHPVLRQIAGDLCVNSLLMKKAGRKFPAGCILPGQGAFAKYLPDLSLEAYYEMLLRDCKDGGDDGEEGGTWNLGGPSDDPGKMGGVEGCASEEQAQELRQRIERALNLAAMSGRGDTPAWIEELIGRIKHVPLHWLRYVEQYLDPILFPDEHSWRRPNRRYLVQRLILPTCMDEKFPHIGVVRDTSGSISTERLQRFTEELIHLISGVPTVKVSLYDHDVKAELRQEWHPEDGEIVKPKPPVGRGGTSHIPLFELIGKQDDKPELLICCTDLETQFPPQAPAFPVLWVVPPGYKSNHSTPWGTILEMNE